MQEAEAYAGREQCLDVLTSASAVWETEDVLSRDLPPFYGSAYRLLGRAADAKQEAAKETLHLRLNLSREWIKK
jgi:hypothetical protein